MWQHLAGQTERCDLCRFDGAAYTDLDVAGTLKALGPWAAAAVTGLDRAELNRRPTPTTWSVAEYLRHTKRVLWTMAGLVEMTASTDGGSAGPDLTGGPPPDARADDPPADLDADREATRLGQEAVRLHDLWTGPNRVDKSRELRLNGASADVAGIVRHAVHDAVHHLGDIGRGVAHLQGPAAIGDGVIGHLHRSNGGVPKQTIDSAEVLARGLVGDRQSNRRHHGRAWQAVCLWSGDVIRELVDEGHPIGPGSAGENVTIDGLDWSTMRPGRRLRFGDDPATGVLLETTGWTEPCSTIAAGFTGRNFRRIDADRVPGSSRIYATVLRDGTLRTGDAVHMS